MLALQAPPRNLFSARIPRASAAHNVADYLASLRGAAPTWGVEGNHSPQWYAGHEIVAEMRLAARLTGRLQSMTRLRALAAEAPLSTVVETYLADAALLGDHCDAVNNLFATIADAQTQPAAVVTIPEVGPYDPNFHYYQQQVARLQANVEKARSTFARGLFVPGGVLGAHVVTAQLLATPDVALHALQEDIDRRCRALGDHAVQCLCGGLESGLLGLVAWPAASACWYVRSERIVQLADPVRNVYKHWHRTHEVHLLDAEQLAGIPGWLDLPPAVKRVVDAVPPLLHPDLSTVVGTMVRQRQIDWVIGEAAYPEERVEPQRTLIIDPAICVGSVVLTGWEDPLLHRVSRWWMRLDRYLTRGGAPAGDPRGQAVTTR